MVGATDCTLLVVVVVFEVVVSVPDPEVLLGVLFEGAADPVNRAL
jgi:hypothetical protein